MAKGPTMQAACLECAGQGSPRAIRATAEQGWLTRALLAAE
jgi:hypothetical protein